MNKKLLALAVAGAMAAPLAVHADTVIFGQAHMSIDWLDDGEDSAFNVSSNTSNLGFRGREDLGAGLFASWQLHQSIGVDTSGGSLASMNSFAGLGGAFGEVRVGRHDTPLKSIHRRTDLFGNQIGDSRNLIAGRGAVGGITGERFNNMVMYLSPSIGGLQGAVMYSADITATAATTDNDSDALSANLTWSQGPIWLGAGFTQINSDATDPRAWGIGARVGWEAFTFTGLYHRERDEGDANRNIWGIGAAFAMGNNTLKAQYYNANDWEADATGADLWAIGIDHHLSKRTTLYAAYAQTDNDGNASYSMSGGGHGANVGAFGPGSDPQGFSLGVLHNF
jgi:predicted porin